MHPSLLIAAALTLAATSTGSTPPPPNATPATPTPDPASSLPGPPRSLRPSPFPPAPACINTPTPQYWNGKRNACLPCAPHAASCADADWATACEGGWDLWGGECHAGRMALELGAREARRRGEEEEAAGRKAGEVREARAAEGGRFQRVFRVPKWVAGGESMVLDSAAGGGDAHYDESGRFVLSPQDVSQYV